MVTPFDERGEVDYERAKRLAVALLDSGSDGVVVVGTTGESPTLVREEEIRLFAEVKSVVGDRGTVVAGTGSNSTAEAVAATKEAEQTGVDFETVTINPDLGTYSIASGQWSTVAGQFHR